MRVRNKVVGTVSFRKWGKRWLCWEKWTVTSNTKKQNTLVGIRIFRLKILFGLVPRRSK